MATVIPGRYTAVVGDEFVVFLVGMRINHFWKIHKCERRTGRGSPPGRVVPVEPGGGDPL